MKAFIYVTLATLLFSLVAFGQTTPTSTSLTADLSPSNLVPPVEDRTESASVEVDITFVEGTGNQPESAVLSYTVTLDSGDIESLTGIEVRRGATGLNGPVSFQAMFNMDDLTGSTVSGQVTITGSSQLNTLRSIVESPSQYHVVISTSDNPSGLLRGQLEEGDDMGEDMDNLTSKVDRLEERLVLLHSMVRQIGLVLGQNFPEAEPIPGDAVGDDDDSDSTN